MFYASYNHHVANDTSYVHFLNNSWLNLQPESLFLVYFAGSILIFDLFTLEGSDGSKYSLMKV